MAKISNLLPPVLKTGVWYEVFQEIDRTYSAPTDHLLKVIQDTNTATKLFRDQKRGRLFDLATKDEYDRAEDKDGHVLVDETNEQTDWFVRNLAYFLGWHFNHVLDRREQRIVYDENNNETLETASLDSNIIRLKELLKLVIDGTSGLVYMTTYDFVNFISYILNVNIRLEQLWYDELGQEILNENDSLQSWYTNSEVKSIGRIIRFIDAVGAEASIDYPADTIPSWNRNDTYEHTPPQTRTDPVYSVVRRINPDTIHTTHPNGELWVAIYQAADIDFIRDVAPWDVEDYLKAQGSSRRAREFWSLGDTDVEPYYSLGDWVSTAPYHVSRHFNNVVRYTDTGTGQTRVFEPVQNVPAGTVPGSDPAYWKQAGIHGRRVLFDGDNSDDNLSVYPTPYYQLSVNADGFPHLGSLEAKRFLKILLEILAPINVRLTQVEDQPVLDGGGLILGLVATGDDEYEFKAEGEDLYLISHLGTNHYSETTQAAVRI